MFNLKGSLEDQISANEKRLKELKVRDEVLHNEFNALLAEQGLTQEAVTEYLSNPENFTPEQWQEIQRERIAYEKALKEDLQQVHDVRSSSRARADLQSARQWIPCK